MLQLFRPRVFLCPVVLSAVALLAGCGTNPVTGESELQFISTTAEIRMGEQAYFPTRQVQGGDYVVHPEVTDYVRRVNQRLTAVAHRDLPFEIVVLNSSVPNAWAMPGGKMAINRGLLIKLQSEAELAAVLGHEIVHSAARHSAQAQERGMLLQGGLLAVQVAAADNDYRDLIAGGSLLGAQLVSTRYGREAELEADLYGMQYMLQAGYNPAAAIDLQQTFVKLSEGRSSTWLDGLFASHPPSQARVERNRATAARLGGEDLEYGKQRYRRAIAPLLKDQEAYAAHDAALQAAKDENYARASRLIEKAIQLQPRESKFYGLKGDLALMADQYHNATRHYDRAIALYPDYFAYHLQKGLALRQLGSPGAAAQSLRQSNELLPNPIAQKLLGDFALLEGDRSAALNYYQSAASSNSEYGEQARVALARLQLEEKPANYLKTGLTRDGKGATMVVVRNNAPIAVKNVEIGVAYFDQQGRQLSEVKRLRVRGAIQAGQQVKVATGLPEGNGLRSTVLRAQVLE